MLVAAGANADLFGTSSASIYGVNPLNGELNFIGTTADGDPNQGSNVKTLQSIALARNRDGNCANRPFSIRRKRNRAPEGLICSLFRQLANVFFGLRTTAISNMAKMPLYRLEFHAKSQPLDAIMLRNPLNNNNKNRYFLPFWTTLRV